MTRAEGPWFETRNWHYFFVFFYYFCTNYIDVVESIGDIFKLIYDHLKVDNRDQLSIFYGFSSNFPWKRPDLDLFRMKPQTYAYFLEAEIKLNLSFIYVDWK